MKKNLLRISILPLVFLFAVSFTSLPPQKEKTKGENPQEKGNQNNKGNSNNNADKSSRSNQNDDGRSGKDRGNTNNGQPEDKGQGNGNSKNNGNANDRRDDSDKNKGLGNKNNENGKGNGNDKDGNDKGNGNGKFRKEAIKWDRDENVVWGFENYSSRKRPKDFKKVSVCHNTGDNDYPVTINVSENALKAHLNHGDQVGNCTGNYSERWPADFTRTRENVYNNYQTTWETMSYSEALVRFAADKLLGIKSTFQAQRPTLTAEEIQRRELLILDLQTNVNSLENQLNISRQRTAGLNINVNL